MPQSVGHHGKEKGAAYYIPFAHPTVCKDAVGWSKCRAQFAQLHEHFSAFCPPIKNTDKCFVHCFSYRDGAFPEKWWAMAQPSIAALVYSAANSD
jgi:hypothetical protein